MTGQEREQLGPGTRPRADRCTCRRRRGSRSRRGPSLHRAGHRGGGRAPSCRHQSDLRRRCNGSPMFREYSSRFWARRPRAMMPATSSTETRGMMAHRRVRRTALSCVAVLLSWGSLACAPRATVTPSAPATFDEKVSSILRLENQRMLRDVPPVSNGPVDAEGAPPVAGQHPSAGPRAAPVRPRAPATPARGAGDRSRRAAVKASLPSSRR